MSENRCCVLRGFGPYGDGPSEADRCPNAGVFPYYTERVCEPCARAMLPEDVLPVETIAAMIAKDALAYGNALRDCTLAGSQRDLLPRMALVCGHLGHALIDAEFLRDGAIRAR